MSEPAKRLSIVERPRAATAAPPIPRFTVARMMTVEELMAWLQVEESTVYGWVHRRQIPFHKLGPAMLGGRKRERDSRPLRFDYYEILTWHRTGELPEWFENQ